MALGITPVVEGDVPPGTPFPKFIQFRSGGANLGDQGVQVVDIVGDPTRVLVTRGVGENSHVVTMRLIPPPAPVGVIAWLGPDVHVSSGSATANNEGTDEDYSQADFHELHAGMVGYAGETLVWTLDSWLPFFGQAAPVLTPVAGGKVKLTFFRDSSGGGTSDQFGAGIATVTCTINGQPATVELTAMMGSDFYAPLSWRTADPLLEVGWNGDVHAEGSVAVHSNQGTESYPGSAVTYYATVCDYDQVTTPAVVWDTDWVPFASDPAPSISTSGYGQKLVVDFTDVTANSAARGTLTISATVAGQPTNSIQLVVGAGPFNTMTWGPVP